MGEFMTDEAAAGNNGDNLRQRYETIEEQRQRVLVYVGNGLSGVFLFGFGIANLISGHRVLAAFTLVHGVITIGNILLFKFTRNRDWAGYGFAYGLLALFTYLIATGGVDHTGPLWSFPMVAATITLLGARRGLMVIGTMFAIALVLFLMPLPLIELAPYSTNFKIRFIATFAVLSLFTALHEYARARNQSELIRVSAQFDRLSHTDVLTALPNRRYMMEKLEAENSRFIRHLHPYSILYGDIDNFKSINDRYGHQVGDAALQAIAHVLRSSLRQHDEVSRWGGEEFLVLLPETDARVALEVAEKLREAIAAIDFRQGDAKLPLTMSFGVQTVSNPDRVDALIHAADQKLYQAKQSGKNRIVAELQSA